MDAAKKKKKAFHGPIWLDTNSVVQLRVLINEICLAVFQLYNLQKYVTPQHFSLQI